MSDRQTWLHRLIEANDAGRVYADRTTPQRAAFWGAFPPPDGLRPLLTFPLYVVTERAERLVDARLMRAATAALAAGRAPFPHDSCLIEARDGPPEDGDISGRAILWVRRGAADNPREVWLAGFVHNVEKDIWFGFPPIAGLLDDGGFVITAAGATETAIARRFVALALSVFGLVETDGADQEAVAEPVEMNRMRARRGLSPIPGYTLIIPTESALAALARDFV